MKTIKIFLASSYELKDDRDEIRLFLSVENDRLHTKGYYLQMVQWEYFLDAVSTTSLQSEYNKALKECDIVVSLFFTKAGKYTQEEFEKALESFKTTGKPLIYTYFKDAPVNMGSITEQVLSLFEFKKRLDELGHFPTFYKDVTDFKYKFKLQLDKLFESGVFEKQRKQNSISQVHSGTGDNVAGDKIGTQVNMGNQGTSEIKVGELVVHVLHKSRPMVVRRINEGKALCFWEVEGKPVSADYPLSELSKYA